MRDLIENYKVSKKKIDNLGKEIFEYIYKNYPNSLRYYKCAKFGEEVIIDDDYLCIKYYDQSSWTRESTYFRIPLTAIYTNTWKKYIQS